MAEIVNLRQARKKKARGDKDARAASNRAKFGQTMAARLKAASEKNQLAKVLDGARMDKNADETSE